MVDEKKGRRFYQFQFSTLLLASVLVMFPWALVSLPGVNTGGAGTTGFGSGRYWHGWPFRGLEGQTVEFDGDWAVERIGPASNPDELALKYLNEPWSDPELRGLRADWRLGVE